jgi:hypothetical protein
MTVRLMLHVHRLSAGAAVQTAELQQWQVTVTLSTA